jgi:hypothetical protein
VNACRYQSSCLDVVRPNQAERKRQPEGRRWCAESVGSGGDGFADADGGEPVVAVFGEAVDDVEEGLVEGGGDGAHGSVADQDAVDGAEVGDFCRGAGEEGLVANVEELAGEGLLDDGDAHVAGEDEDGIAGDAVQDGVGERRSVEGAAADDEEVFAGALGEVAVDVEGDAFVVAVGGGFHADELGVHVVGAGLGERGHGVGGEAVPAGDADVGALVAVEEVAPGEVGDVDLDGRVEGVDADFAVAAEGDGADVAGGCAVGFDDIDDGGFELLDGVREVHAVDFAGVEEALHVLGEAEDCGAVGLGITADALKDGGAVVDDVAHDVDVGLLPGDELAVVPDVFGGLDRHGTFLALIADYTWEAGLALREPLHKFCVHSLAEVWFSIPEMREKRCMAT